MPPPGRQPTRLHTAPVQRAHKYGVAARRARNAGGAVRGGQARGAGRAHCGCCVVACRACARLVLQPRRQGDHAVLLAILSEPGKPLRRGGGAARQRRQAQHREQRERSRRARHSNSLGAVGNIEEPRGTCAGGARLPGALPLAIAPSSMQALVSAPARRTRAAAAARWCVRALSGSASRSHGHSHGGVPCGGHHEHGPRGPDEAGTLEEGELEDEPMLAPAEPPSEDSGLPVPQRAKNILAANWRGQLSTIELRLGTRFARGARAWCVAARAPRADAWRSARVAPQQSAAQAGDPRLACAVRTAAWRRARRLSGAR